MLRTVVIPASSASRALPAPMSARCDALISATVTRMFSPVVRRARMDESRWAWASTRPGSSVAAPRSMTRAPAGAWAWTCATGPTALMRSPSTSTAWSASARPDSTSIIRAAFTTTARPGSCATATDDASSTTAECEPHAFSTDTIAL